MPLSTQAKILRVLQEREITPRRQPRPARGRAHRRRHTPRPARRGQGGRFREDLWYRLQVVPLWLPPLRERLGDVLLLAEHFLRLLGGDPPKRLSAAAARLLLAHSPGNVRELRNAMERAAILSHGSVIEVEHIGLQAAAAPAPARH